MLKKTKAQTMERSLELLVPAKNSEAGIIAINHGADAVYIGANKYGARQAAGNDIGDLVKLSKYAHLYGSKVYVTINTILYDNELDEVEKLINKLYDIEIDALIIQDLGILKLDLPPIKLHASTQCHNTDVEQIKFIENLGFKRAILARELNLSEISTIKQNTNIELEAFVHGALCVCYSGQCYMSKMLVNRSGNRGECAQVCRSRYNLVDENENIIIENKHLLSLKDMNRSEYITDMIKAGVSSFKIEGRLKDVSYIKNITAYYRKIIDKILETNPSLHKLSSGKTQFFFEPNPQNSFNRGFTNYNINGKREHIASFNTPKAVGVKIGILKQDFQSNLYYLGYEEIVNGDGLCFINSNNELEGFSVNKVYGNEIIPNKRISHFEQVDLYRNVDSAFEKSLSAKTSDRRISVDFVFSETETGFKLSACDEDNCMAETNIIIKKDLAIQKEKAESQLITSLSKLGNTPFAVKSINNKLRNTYFFTPSTINHLKNEVIDKLIVEREKKFKPLKYKLEYTPKNIFENINYKRNVINEKHKNIFEDFGAKNIEYGIDKTNDFDNKDLMVCKHCIRFEIDDCLKEKGNNTMYKQLYLSDNHGFYKLAFDCKNCKMTIIKK